MLNRVLSALAIATLAATANAAELSDEERAAIAARLAPAGSLCLRGANCAGIPERVVAALPAVEAPAEAEPIAEASENASAAEAAEIVAAETVVDEVAENAPAEGVAEDAVAAVTDAASEALDTAVDSAAAAIDDAADAASQAVASTAEDAAAEAVGAAEAAGAAAAAVVGTASSAGSDPSAVVASAEGEAVYNGACLACHAYGAAGSPIVGDTDAWAPRIAKGMDALYASGLNGIAGTGMIAKGGRPDLSDEAVKAAVDYMVAKSR